MKIYGLLRRGVSCRSYWSLRPFSFPKVYLIQSVSVRNQASRRPETLFGLGDGKGLGGGDGFTVGVGVAGGGYLTGAGATGGEYLTGVAGGESFAAGGGYLIAAGGGYLTAAGGGVFFIGVGGGGGFLGGMGAYLGAGACVGAGVGPYCNIDRPLFSASKVKCLVFSYK